MFLAIALLIAQAEAKTLVFGAEKDPTTAQLDRIVKSLDERLVAYGYKDLAVSKDGKQVLIKKKTGTFDDTTTKAIERLLKVTGQKAELRVFYKMTPAENDQFKPSLLADGSFGNAPPRTKWLHVLKPDLTEIDGLYPIRDAPVILFSDLTKVVDKTKFHHIRFKPNKNAEAALRPLDREGESPFLYLVIDGMTIEGLWIAFTFTSDGGAGRAAELWLQAKVEPGRDFPILPLVIMENPLPFPILLKESKP